MTSINDGTKSTLKRFPTREWEGVFKLTANDKDVSPQLTGRASFFLQPQYMSLTGRTFSQIGPVLSELD